MQMNHVNTQTLIPAAAHVATFSSRAQKPANGLRFDEDNALAGRRSR